MRTFAVFSAIVLLASCSSQKKTEWAESPVDHVVTLMGSQSKHSLSTGNTYPAIAMPWGMNFWTPQTGKMGDGWAYTYDAEKIRGFKQTHQPSPWINDYGQFSIMPVTGTPTFDEDMRASWFSHKAETATPYYYSVYLADYDVTAELTPTERAAMFRFTFPETDSAYVIIDAFDRGSAIEIDTMRHRITGYTTKNSGGVPENFRNYFVIEFDRPFTSIAAVTDGVVTNGSVASESDHAGAIVGFTTQRGEQVMARVASSFISPEQALLNLKETDGNDFEQLKTKGKDRWNEVLGAVRIGADAPTDQLRTFYSCLYRSTLFPRSFYEIDAEGNPVHYSPYSGEVLPGYMFTDTGFWDTFRSLFPLVNLLYPSMSQKMQQGLANAWRESGFLPEWASPGHRDCMVGNNSASVVADAAIKGIEIPADDAEALWQAVTHGAHAVHPQISSTGRRGYEYYDSLGYVPCNVGINESAARTLEYAYDDWCIYRLGQKLGKPEEELASYLKSSQNYRNLFDPETKLMRGRQADGSFRSDFNPLQWGGDFTEGNSWHYTWSVFHDPQGLIELMGGNEQFAAMLDSVFALPPVFDESYYGFVIHEIREMQIMNMGNYAHGNQPIQHMIYLYDYCNQPRKAQYWLREAMDRLYSPTPDGYCGDEDNGQTSAWYVFSALGFYPVCPASDEYALGTPLFTNAQISLENGNTVEIYAPEVSSSKRFVKELKIDGLKHAENFIKHSTLTNGAKLLFDMTE